MVVAASNLSDQVNGLLHLAQDNAAESRRLLLENISDLFLSPEGRLSERERALMNDILSKLLGSVEMEIRRDLAERLAVSQQAPRELIAQLANDDISVAEPLLRKSKLLSNPDLIEIVKHRTSEHRICIAARDTLDMEVSDAIVASGDADAITTLLENQNAEISELAMEYIVAQSQRVDRFQEPLLARSDLPSQLAYDMFWWVSAALRRHILDNYRIDPALIDEALSEATKENANKDIPEGALLKAYRLACKMKETRELTERFVLQSLKAGQVPVFIAGLACMTGIDVVTARRIVLDPGIECLAILCRAAGFDRNSFANIFLLARKFQSADDTVATPTSAVGEALNIFDGLSLDECMIVIKAWSRHPDYDKAVKKFEQRLNNAG